jgi:hypothetical protein
MFWSKEVKCSSHGLWVFVLILLILFIFYLASSMSEWMGGCLNGWYGWMYSWDKVWYIQIVMFKKQFDSCHIPSYKSEITSRSTPCNRFSQRPPDTCQGHTHTTLLLNPFARKLSSCEHISWVECVYILECNFTFRSFTAVHEAFRMHILTRK